MLMGHCSIEAEPTLSVIAEGLLESQGSGAWMVGLCGELTRVMMEAFRRLVLNSGLDRSILS